MKTEIYKLSATELSKAYENKALSPVEVTNSIIDRIKDVDDKINAYVFIDEESAMKQAKDSESRWKNGSQKRSLIIYI